MSYEIRRESEQLTDIATTRTSANRMRHWHELATPLAEMVLTGCLFAALACIRFFKNDKGQTLFEYGLENVTYGHSGQTTLRILSFIAAAQVTMFLTYHFPMSMLAVQSRDWPAEVAEKSWLNGGLCGADTDRACPGGDIPIPRPDSPHLSPSGDLISPDGRIVLPRSAG